MVETKDEEKRQRLEKKQDYKLVCFNVWAGTVLEDLVTYLKGKVEEGTDIFCLQEVTKSEHTFYVRRSFFYFSFRFPHCWVPALDYWC